jgi:hypothetical protein
VDVRRFLPIMLIAFAALFILPQLFRSGGGSKTLSSKDRAILTRDAMHRIDTAQMAELAAHGRYTGNVADLVVADKVLARELTVPLEIDLDVGAGGKSYVVRVSSDVLAVARARSGDAVVASNCRVVKSRTGFKCPEPAPAATKK